MIITGAEKAFDKNVTPFHDKILQHTVYRRNISKNKGHI